MCGSGLSLITHVAQNPIDLAQRLVSCPVSGGLLPEWSDHERTLCGLWFASCELWARMMELTWKTDVEMELLKGVIRLERNIQDLEGSGV